MIKENQTFDEYFDYLKALIGNAKTEKVIKELNDFLKYSNSFYTTFLTIKGHFTQQEEDFLIGSIRRTDFNAEMNNINNRLLRFINKISDLKRIVIWNVPQKFPPLKFWTEKLGKDLKNEYLTIVLPIENFIPTYRLLKDSDYFIPIISQNSLQFYKKEILSVFTSINDNLKLTSIKKPHTISIKTQLKTETLFSNIVNEHYFELSWNDTDDTEQIIEQIVRIVNKEFYPITHHLTFKENKMDIQDYLDEDPTGTVGLENPFYVARKEDNSAKRALRKKRVLLRIKGRKQFGKSSLVIRLIDYSKKEIGYHFVSVSFELFKKSGFIKLEPFLKEFCCTIANKLKISEDIEEIWNKTRLGIMARAEEYIKRILEYIDQPLVIALDETDKINLEDSESVASDFFSFLRYLYNLGATDNIWANLKIVIAYSTDLHLIISDPNQSPFNVGSEVYLEDFTFKEVTDLAQKHLLNFSTSEVEELMNHIGGHPYLIRVALGYSTIHQLSFKQFLVVVYKENGPYKNHIDQMKAFIRLETGYERALKDIIKSGKTIASEKITRELKTRGIIKPIKGSRNYCVSYPLYEYFIKEFLY